jgi:carbamate kinase
MPYLVSVGGNALKGRQTEMSKLAFFLSRIIGNGKVVLTHGNGPQVGAIESALPETKLGIATAMTQAEIGIRLKEGVLSGFGHNGNHKDLRIDVLITEVFVKETRRDMKPVKPIGSYYKTRKEALSELGSVSLASYGKGYRRVVPSPEPLRLARPDSLHALLECNDIVIAGGGGGVPVIETSRGREIAECVVDKDYTSAMIAQEIGSSIMYIFTDVDGVYEGFGTKKQRLIERLSAREAKDMAENGELEGGSIEPKVSAAARFTERTGGISVIANLLKPDSALSLSGCTVIYSGN